MKFYIYGMGYCLVITRICMRENLNKFSQQINEGDHVTFFVLIFI